MILRTKKYCNLIATNNFKIKRSDEIINTEVVALRRIDHFATMHYTPFSLPCFSPSSPFLGRPL